LYRVIKGYRHCLYVSLFLSLECLQGPSLFSSFLTALDSPPLRDLCLLFSVSLRTPDSPLFSPRQPIEMSCTFSSAVAPLFLLQRHFRPNILPPDVVLRSFLCGAFAKWPLMWRRGFGGKPPPPFFWRKPFSPPESHRAWGLFFPAASKLDAKILAVYSREDLIFPFSRAPLAKSLPPPFPSPWRPLSLEAAEFFSFYLGECFNTHSPHPARRAACGHPTSCRCQCNFPASGEITLRLRLLPLLPSPISDPRQ